MPSFDMSGAESHFCRPDRPTRAGCHRRQRRRAPLRNSSLGPPGNSLAAIRRRRSGRMTIGPIKNTVAAKT
jgi:hypothetical protein